MGKDSREYAAAAWEAEQAQKQEAERQLLVKEIFTMFDANDDGKLSKDEYKSYLIGIGMFGPYADDYDSKGWSEECAVLGSSTEEGISWDAFESKLYGPERRGRGEPWERLDQAKVDLSMCKHYRSARRAGRRLRARAGQGGQAGGGAASYPDDPVKAFPCNPRDNRLGGELKDVRTLVKFLLYPSTQVAWPDSLSFVHILSEENKELPKGSLIVCAPPGGWAGFRDLDDVSIDEVDDASIPTLGLYTGERSGMWPRSRKPKVYFWGNEVVKSPTIEQEDVGTLGDGYGFLNLEVLEDLGPDSERRFKYVPPKMVAPLLRTLMEWLLKPAGKDRRFLREQENDGPWSWWVCRAVNLILDGLKKENISKITITKEEIETCRVASRYAPRGICQPKAADGSTVEPPPPPATSRWPAGDVAAVERRREERRKKRGWTSDWGGGQRSGPRQSWAQARLAGGMSGPEYREEQIAKAAELAALKEEAIANMNAVLEDSGATVESVTAAIGGRVEEERLKYWDPELMERAHAKLTELKAAGKKRKGRFRRAKSG